MQAIARAMRFQIELSPNLLADLLAKVCVDEKIPCQVLLSFLGNVVRFTEQGQVILRIYSECPCLGVLVERLLIENSKLMPWQCLRFGVSDRGIALAQRILEKAIAPLVARYFFARYLYRERSS